jgi:Fe-S-cluster-containing dehydrogenase component
MVSAPKERKWQLAVDADRCTGCQACVVACQAENNVPINSMAHFDQKRTHSWIRIERYWEGEFPNVKARFMPVMCQQCGNAPCEPVCPVFATYHNNEGLNVQVYNVELRNQLNPDVTVRSRGVMEKCTFCVQRIRRAELDAKRDGTDIVDGQLQTACAQACPTGALVFGDIKDPDSKVSALSKDKRRFRLLESLGTDATVVYLNKIDHEAKVEAHA